MPKYYCNYCDTYLTHDSPSVRKTHCTGRKHKDSVKFYYQKWMEKQAQNLIDATTAAFKAGKIANNPFAQAPKGVAIPPPPQLTVGHRPTGLVAPGMMAPGQVPTLMMAPHCPMPPMMGMHPQMVNMIQMASLPPTSMGSVLPPM